MGGAAPEPAAKGGKKSMDAHVNLVPYIDLLMTIMTFLVMTAVWTQIATLEVQNSAGGQPPETQEEEDKDKPKPIIVLITDSAIKVQEEGAELQEFPMKGADEHDIEGVTARLQALKDERPERTEVKIQAEDGVPYRHIIAVIDAATGICVDPKDKSTCLSGLTLTPAQGS